MAMEALSCILCRAKKGGFLAGFSADGGGEDMEVSHLLFADDMLILCDASKEHKEHLSWVLIWFETILGLKINLEKSKLIIVRLVVDVDDLARVLGCKVGTLPTSYLGLSLRAPSRFSRVWDVVEERFQKQLAM